jgi:imidazolonepropionase-like amidohydrolase
MGLGTDPLGALHVRQSSEFTLRAKVLPAIDVLRSACTVNADLLGQTGNLGSIREGAIADLLVVDGNPLEDISVLGAGGILVEPGKAWPSHGRATLRMSVGFVADYTFMWQARTCR